MSEFKTLMSYINNLRERYYNTLSAFFVYEGMREVMAPNIIGEEEAKANVETINRYKNFFNPATEALRTYFFIELAKLFDSSNQSLHITKVVNFTESQIKHLDVDAFKEYNNQEQGRKFLDELAAWYKGVTTTDLKEIRRELVKHAESIEKLKTYRDKWLAYDDIDKPQIPNITGEELRCLFSVLEKILNSLTSKLNSSKTMWDHVEGDCKHHAKSVVNHLRRFEHYRIKEIEAECTKMISQHKVAEEQK